jgi:hypothetical protein
MSDAAHPPIPTPVLIGMAAVLLVLLMFFLLMDKYEAIEQLIKLNAAIKENPENAMLFAARSEVNLSPKQWSEAIADCDCAVLLNGATVKVHNTHCTALIEQKLFGRPQRLLNSRSNSTRSAEWRCTMPVVRTADWVIGSGHSPISRAPNSAAIPVATPKSKMPPRVCSHQRAYVRTPPPHCSPPPPLRPPRPPSGGTLSANWGVTQRQ